MHRRNRVGSVLAMMVAAAAGLVVSCGTLARAEAPYRPNIVMFVVHDLGQHLGCYGVPSVQTPNIDVLPTLLDFLGAPIPHRIEGVSHKAWIEGKTDQSPRREVFGQFTPAMKRDNESRSVLTDRYQLIWYVGAGRVLPYPVDVHPKDFALHVARVRTGGARPFLQLYDLQSDPYQLKDIAGQPENAEVVKDLSGRLTTWMKRVNDPLLEGPTATPYYQKATQALMEAAEE